MAREISAADLDAYEKARALRIALARKNSALFASYVIRNDRTGEDITLAPMHQRWHQLAEMYDRLILFGFTSAGKTVQITALILHAICKNPNIRVVVLGNTHGQAKKITRSVRQYIERSKPLHDVVPLASGGEQWTDDAFTVKRDSYAKDPTVQAFGVHGSILGSRIDLLVMDDVIDFENSATPAARRKLYDWYSSTMFGRLDPKTSRVIALGNAWHRDDLLHLLEKQEGWHTERFPVAGQDGAPAWPDVWPLESIAKRRTELGSMEFQRQMMCVAPGGGTNSFRAWVDKCIANGEGKRINARMTFTPPGYKIITGVDLAVQKGEGHDWTVLLTIAVAPNGMRTILNIERGRWNGPEIISKMLDVNAGYHPHLYVVENNGAQDFLRQFAVAGTALPIRAFTTGRNKAHPEHGVQSMFVELENAKWVIPSKGGQVHECLNPLVDELTNYDANEHTGDCLMAMWFAREGIAMGEIKAEVGNMRLRAR